MNIQSAQDRVSFHLSRLFASTGGRGREAHREFLGLASSAGLPVAIPTYTHAQCRTALQLIEQASRTQALHHFRDVRTQWEGVPV